MRKIIITFVLAIMACTPAIAQNTPTDTTVLNKDSMLTVGMNRILDYMLLTRDDFTFRDDYTKKDPYRLKLIDKLMAHPIRMADFAENCADEIMTFRDNPSAGLRFLSEQRGNREFAKQPESPEFPSWLKKTNKISGRGGNIRRLLECLFKSHSHIKARMGGDWKSDLNQFIVDKYKALILDEPDYRIYTNEQLDSMQHVEDEDAKEFAEIGKDIPDISFSLAGCNLFASIDSIYAQFKNNEQLIKKSKPGKLLYEKDTPFGKIVIGSYGDDIYRGDYFMILDPGGNDNYYLDYDLNKPHPSAIIDLDGNDTYTAESDFALASGAFSYSYLVDYSGDDIYKGKNFSLGSGYFGVGILWDKKGNDSYFGDTFVEGAGTFGLGLLIDEEGSDTYIGNLQCQGFGFVRGIGGVADYSGNDTYTIQPKYKEYFHPGNHYTSLSQGFSIGVRPYLSGGFGFICDYGGNDSYVADFFAQASAYWWSLGMIYDKSGNDLYYTYQYAQGAGAHMALGMLLDNDGDDVYRSHGVCQGCGHDYSCGWLLDKGGDDIYSAQGLAQGAGQANGIGIFNDLTGDDGYYVFMKKNTQGYGNPRRDYGSIGVFLDMNGTDHYDGNGSNSKFWKVPGKWGGGLDYQTLSPDSTEGK